MAIISKSGKELVWDLINQANPRPVPFSDANSVIEAITGGSFTQDGVTYNTKARLRGLSTTGYTGSVTVYYNRLTLPNLFRNQQASIESYSATDVHTVLPVLNRSYGLNLLTSDITNASLARANTPNYTDLVNLAPAATSALLAPGSVTMRYTRGLPYLEAYVLTKSLGAYTHPVSDTTKQAAQLLTFGLDFTDYKNLLLVDGTGMPNFAALQQVLTVTYGLPAWDAPLNSNYVTDNATSAVTNANQKYDRVVVQTGINNSQVAGVAYYHYMS